MVILTYIYSENIHLRDRSSDLLSEIGPVNFIYENDLTSCEWDKDYEILIRAMEESGILEKMKNCEEITDYLLVAKDTIVSSASALTVNEFVQKIVISDMNIYCDNPNKFDLFYLSHWLDRCDQYCLINSNGTGPQIVKIYSPNGFHSVIFSPSGLKKIYRDYNPCINPIIGDTLGSVLNKRIDKNGNSCDYPCEGKGSKGSSKINRQHSDVYDALGCTPNLLCFDIINSTCIDGLKMAECRDVPTPYIHKRKYTEYDMTLFWFLLIMLVVIITIVITIWFITKYSYMCGKNI